MALTRSPGVRGETAANGPTPHDMRRALEALLGSKSPGVIDGCTVTGTASWEYAVAAGWLATRRAATDGMNVWTNDAQYLVGTDPAPGSGSRIDIVYALHRNMQEHSDPDSLPVMDVAKGTPHASSPTAPTIPTGAIELARKVVAAGDTSTSVGAAISHANQARAGVVAGIVTGSGAEPQTISTGSSTALTFPGAAVTLLGGVTYGGGVLTVSEPGLYRISVYVRTSGSTATGNFELRLRAGGANVALSCTAYIPGGSWNASAEIYVAGATTVDAYVNQSSGADVTIEGSLGSPRLSVSRIG